MMGISGRDDVEYAKGWETTCASLDKLGAYRLLCDMTWSYKWSVAC